MTTARDPRWPRWVYDEGQEPDYRFTFANERTFLAWIRTGLALIAAGVALEALPLDLAEIGQRILAALLLVLGMLCAGIAWTRWAQAERAMRLGRALPSSRVTALLSIAVVLTGVLVLIFGG